MDTNKKSDASLSRKNSKRRKESIVKLPTLGSATPSPQGSFKFP